MIRLSNIGFSYGQSQELVLQDINLIIDDGEMVAITGPSGSGKSTLFYILGGLLSPSQGTLEIKGIDVYRLDPERRAAFRNQVIGFIFQQFHLLPKTSVLDNILLPAVYAKLRPGRFVELAKSLAGRLGLSERLAHRPDQLSGGQQQRVAVARALLFDPNVVLCDEPTGNLDSKNAKEVLKILNELNSLGKTVIVITHDPVVASGCSRQIEIQDGRVVSDSKSQSPTVSDSRGVDLDLGRSFRWFLNQSVLPGIQNISRNKFKSFLTMIGVSVGTAALVAVMTLGDFAKRRILEGYESLGVNRIDGSVYRSWSAAGRSASSVFRGLTVEGDLDPLQSVFPQIRYVTPITRFHVEQVIYGGRRITIDNNSRVLGVNEKYFAMSSFSVGEGRGLSAMDIRDQKSHCVLGARLVESIMSKRIQTIVGETIGLMSGRKMVMCRVIGVLASIRSNQERNRPDQNIYAPYGFVQNLSWDNKISSFAVTTREVQDVEPLTLALKNYFKHKYGEGVEVWIDNDAKLLAQMNRFLALFTALLTAVAVISLVVGGVGIYNMMAVSVSERLREIGLRKAIGAGDRVIRMMVLFESSILCGVAGVFGVALGLGGCAAIIYIVSQMMPKVKFEWLIHPWSIVISMCLCVLTGVLSGLIPARRAQRMQIIEAMRVE
jgi:macrolide transport system ATP-binding/permease protein